MSKTDFFGENHMNANEFVITAFDQLMKNVREKDAPEDADSLLLMAFNAGIRCANDWYDQQHSKRALESMEYLTNMYKNLAATATSKTHSK